MKEEQIKTLVSLTLAKIEILKMKADFYTWSAHVDDDTKKRLEKALLAIDKIIEQL